MLKKENIICLSSIDWDFIWQGHQEIMSTFAKNGNRVLFIENTGVRVPAMRDISRIKKRIKNWFKGIMGIREEMENLYIFSPLILPFPYSRIAIWFNRHLILPILENWMKIMDFSDPIIWTFLPTPLSLDIIDNLLKKLIVYYCIDNFQVSSALAKKIKKSEIRMLKKVDLVFVTSKALYDYCSKYNQKVYRFPFAVSFDKFEKTRLNNEGTPDDLKHIRHPIIGYVGGIHKWIDQNLIRYLTEAYPDYSFVFIGPIQTDISLLSGLKNVNFLGNKDHRELPIYIKNFDLCIIPYLITDYTKNVYPTKLNEYLAMGKTVISTAIPEVIEFTERYKDNIIYIAQDKKSFGQCIEKAIAENDVSIIDKRVEVARENSWENRLCEMANLIECEIEKKRSNREIRWRENLIYFYRIIRRRVLKFSAICIFLYLLIFKTSFILFLAEPLKIVNIPQKADAIVVFAGGVGESGKAGQGYEERVEYAVELYKRGYAKHIIFSSGYRFVFEEPLIMKALAISLGVPEETITLEDKARNTYENVKFSEEILIEKNWHKILLVTTPYHMRRVYLVFKKIAPEINTIYTPIPQSSFYNVDLKEKHIKILRSVELQQIRGILHEYLGIVYYCLKGLI